MNGSDEGMVHCKRKVGKLIWENVIQDMLKHSLILTPCCRHVEENHWWLKFCDSLRRTPRVTSNTLKSFCGVGWLWNRTPTQRTKSNLLSIALEKYRCWMAVQLQDTMLHKSTRPKESNRSLHSVELFQRKYSDLYWLLLSQTVEGGLCASPWRDSDP